MQIDLFKDPEVHKDLNRLLAQVETRAFHLNCSKEELKNACIGDENFFKEIEEVLDKPRVYKQVYGCSYDSHFLLEALGVGRDCKRYTIIVDLSDKLDYILHRLTGCPTDKIRTMPNYVHISRSLLTLDYESLTDVKLGDFLAIDDTIVEWMSRLIDNIVTESNLCDTEILNLLLLRFIRTIVQEANRIKSYIIMYLRLHYSAVVRSKSVSSILATVSEDIDTDCILSESNRPELENCPLQIYKLQKYEFFTGGAYNVLNWLYKG